MKTKHRHHIIPKHMGGKDDPTNLIELTVEEHAEAHRELYFANGHKQDHIAWKTLAGQMTREEAIRKVRIQSNKDRWKDPELAKRIKENMKKAATSAWAEGRQEVRKNLNFKGRKHSEETLKKMADKRKEYWSNPENRKKQSERIKAARSIST
jgi:hypothetical protein